MKKGTMVSDPKTLEGWTKERRFQRTGCELKARFLYRDKWHKAKIITLSGGGAFLACAPGPIKPEEVIWIEFELEGHPISAISRVVWLTRKRLKNAQHHFYPPGFAVEFESMESKGRVLVNRFITKSLRILRALNYELEQPVQELDKIRSLFLILRPGEPLHLNHIRKIVKQESRHFRLRK